MGRLHVDLQRRRLGGLRAHVWRCVSLSRGVCLRWWCGGAQAMIIHAFDGSRIACALLSDGVSATLSASAFVPYFSYTSGSLAVGGSVSPMSTSGTTQTFAYSLSGVDPACSSGAGTAGNSCGSRQPRVDPCDGGLRGCRGCRCRRRRCC